MSEKQEEPPVLAVRVAPWHFLVEAGQVELGQRFSVDGRTFEVIEDPTPIASLTVIARVRAVDGPSTGQEATARLQAGQRQK